MILAALLLAVLPAKAQFVLTGDDPGNLRWYSIETPYYKIIYPQGADSLAVNYGLLLEKYRPAIGLSLGFTPIGEGQQKMPVVLHTHNPRANGSVAWAPKRMDLYTLPDAYGSEPTPWDIQLATHEPRHQAQLELDRHGFWRFPSYVVGQAWTPALFQMYLARCLAEGDAVTVETGLTAGSRARTADFLNYYQVALDAGQYRNWYRWRYGSYKHYTPDFYTLGYITVAGPRALYDDPLAMAGAMNKSRKNPFILGTLNLQRVVRDHSGLKFKDAFPQILDYFNQTWQASAQERAPFTPMVQVTAEESFPVEYSTPTELDGKIYLLREGYLRTPELGWLESGTFRKIMPFASHTSSLFADPVRSRIYWSETLRDPRWTLSGKSIIRYYSVFTNKVTDLTSSGRLYNPQPSPDGTRVAVVEYPLNGGSAVEVLSADDGTVLRRIIAPDGIQVCEMAWMDETIYVSGLSVEGYGIYAIEPDGSWRTELTPSIQKLVNMDASDEVLQWVSDLSGVNELYQYNPATKELTQVTATRFGTTDFTQAGDMLYGVSQTLKGRMLFCTPVDSLAPRQADFSRVHKYPIEDKITKQEASFHAVMPDSVEVSLPKRYSKFGHLMRFHSWAPLYFNYDEVDAASMDFFFDAVAPGATGYFQNTLSTMYGMVGFAYAPDDDGAWRPSGHAKFTYSGWYPVIEAQLDFGGQDAYQIAKASITEENVTTYGLASGRLDTPFVSGLVKAYIPLSWSIGGISYGFIPQVTYNITSYQFDNNYMHFRVETDPNTQEQKYVQEGTHTTSYSPMQRLGAAARGYVMKPRAESQVYPRWGIGLEAGFNMRPMMWHIYRPNAYAYLYGYIPGIARTQGLKLTASYQQQIKLGDELINMGEMALGTLPRGFSSTASKWVANHSRYQAKITADYAIPVYVGDIALPPIAYIRNFLIVPHGDFTFLANDYNLWSVGADITAQMGKFIVPFDCSLGVSISYLGGNAFQASGQPKHLSVGLIMSYDF